MFENTALTFLYLSFSTLSLSLNHSFSLLPLEYFSPSFFLILLNYTPLHNFSSSYFHRICYAVAFVLHYSSSPQFFLSTTYVVSLLVLTCFLSVLFLLLYVLSFSLSCFMFTTSCVWVETRCQLVKIHQCFRRSFRFYSLGSRRITGTSGLDYYIGRSLGGV